MSSRRVRAVYRRARSVALDRDRGEAVRLIDDYHAGCTAPDPGLLVLKGNLLQWAGDFAGAAASYTRALRVDPHHPRALIDRGELLAASRPKANVVRALRHFRRALKSLDGWTPARRFADEVVDATVGAAKALRTLGRPRDAIVVLARALQRYPAEGGLLDALAACRPEPTTRRRATRRTGRR